MDFVKEIEAATGRKLASIDIGGGLSTTYTEAEEPTAFSYRVRLKNRSILDKNIPNYLALF